MLTCQSCLHKHVNHVCANISIFFCKHVICVSKNIQLFWVKLLIMFAQTWQSHITWLYLNLAGIKPRTFTYKILYEWRACRL